MIKDATKQIIKRTLQSSFDKEQFLNFTKNLLNHIDETKAVHFRGQVKHQFKQTTGIVKTYERLGTYTDPSEKKIDILVVYLEKDNSIDRARTSLRNFVADYLKGRDQKDAALVAFVSPNLDDWRFSLIKMEYKFEEGKSGKMKVKEEFTPARRWSFLVGSKESSHTAQSRLAPILEDDESKPTLEQLEDAFNIEKVTKEFFEKYRELFLRLKDNLDEMVKSDAKIKADFAEKDVDTVDFAKKLLGQIVFLYFLQKKGWFGVERDANWGTGPKDFLRQLYNKKHSEYKNFFNEILEPMFYEALARERDDDYYGSFNCKIPFLNGGLFDPIGNYDWVHTDINLDNELFSNSRPTKQGDIGDGILDVFDRYNFTVREDEPLEKEVAVDPEMLGKVFENLLEVKDRKSKGTYYTPREIVHYMCEQSLVNYLVSETGTNKDTFDRLIQLEQFMAQSLPRDEKLKAIAMWEGEVKKIEKALDDIKIVDPACGSGAFLVGMMQEIVELRKIIRLFFKTNELTDYEFKSAIIQNNLYGVDIDPGAVEIAKLRLWLSLVVDENDIKQIKPLPNLDYKIMQGNSLLEEFEGIKLFDESIIPQDIGGNEEQIKVANGKISELHLKLKELLALGKLSKAELEVLNNRAKDQKKIISSLTKKPDAGTNQLDFENKQNEIKAKWDELTGLHKKIVNESNRQEKKKMIDRASELEWQFIEATLKREDKSESLKKIEQFKKKNTKPFFLWHLHFADVFQNNGGFDVAIANPPWISIDNIDESDKRLFKERYQVARSRFDIANLFVELSLDLMRCDGRLFFVIPEHIWLGDYFIPFRKYLKENSNITEVISSKETSFEQVSNPSSIFLAEKSKKQDFLELGTFYFGNHPKKFRVKFDIENRIIFDEFVSKLNTKILKNHFSTLGAIAIVTDGIQTANILKLIFVQEKEQGKNYVKALRSGKEIKFRYAPLEWNGWWALEPAETRTYKRPGFSYDSPKRMSCFLSEEKIILRQTEPTILATLDTDGYYFPNSIFQIALVEPNPKKLRWILGLVNSKFVRYYYSKLSQVEGTTKPQIYLNLLKSISFPEIGIEEISSTVDKILNITKSDDYLNDSTKTAEALNLEHQIDQMVYKLYDLTPEEIKIVEQGCI